MRSLGSQDLATRGVDMLPVQKSAKHCGCPHPVRSADPARRSCCAVCGAAATCKTVANSRKTGSAAGPSRLPGLGSGVQSSFATRRGGIEPFTM